MMLKRLWMLCVLLFLTVTLCSCYPTDKLVFLDQDAPVQDADVYVNIHAVVGENGNCYIRGIDPNQSFLYGVENTEQYKNLYKKLDFSQSAQFVEIYAGGDAEAVRLSGSGGAIVTKESKVYLFADVEGYEIPTYFCDDAKSAFPARDRVYVLTSAGIFGYREIQAPETFVPLAEHVQKFEISSESIWLLSDKGILSVYTDEACAAALWQLEEVSQFDIYNNGEKCVLSYIVNGACYYYEGFGVENAVKYAAKLTDRGAAAAAVYNDGVIVLNENGQVQIFGNAIGAVKNHQGEIIRRNARKICGDFCSIAIITERGELIVAGSLPDDTNVTTSELIKKASHSG